MTDETANLFQTIASLANVLVVLILAGLTYYYARQTKRQADELGKQSLETEARRKRALQPLLHAYLRWSELETGSDAQRMQLVVENIGAGIALNGRVHFEASEKYKTLRFLRLFPAHLQTTSWQYVWDVDDLVHQNIKKPTIKIECEDIEGTQLGPNHHLPHDGILTKPRLGAGVPETNVP